MSCPVVERADGAENLLHQQRRKAERGLVEHQQPRPAHQRAADREHLLLAARQRAAALADTFLQPRERIDQRGGTLSGGEQQMLAIARALMSRPRLLLLDEPSLGLAPLIVRQIFRAIRKLNKREKLTVFLVEQNAFHALKLAHRGYVMVNGRITLTRQPATSCWNAPEIGRPISKAGPAP